LAPGRFSTTTVWPSASLRSWEICRAKVSVAPPGTKATIRRTGRSGKVCACAGMLAAASTHAIKADLSAAIVFPSGYASFP
jgi:hypothetical protein